GVEVRAWDLATSVPWAITPDALERILTVAARPLDERRSADLEALAAQIGRPLDNARTVTVRDGVATVPVTGPIFRRADLFTRISGAASAETLAREIRAAIDDSTVRAVILEIDSPGGEVAG